MQGPPDARANASLASVTAHWPVGACLAGRYVVEGVLARGPLTVVLAVHDRELDQARALKLSVTGSENDRERLVREGILLTRLRSERVVRAHGAGELTDGTRYLVMERLYGRDLDARLRTEGPLPFDVVARALTQIAEALDEVHALGHLHRDLKPANVFECVGGDFKLLDFGVAKSLRERALRRITGARMLVGTVPYLSPEQISGAEPDARSDVWALGVLAFRLLTRALPFGGSRALHETALAIVSSAPRTLAALRPHVPEALQLAIARCLEKRPEDRFASAGSFVSAAFPEQGWTASALADRASAEGAPAGRVGGTHRERCGRSEQGELT
jgi:serine/threonine-protein kinase